MSIANELITRGWTRGKLTDRDGNVCLLGAAAHALNLELDNPYRLYAVVPEVVAVLCALVGGEARTSYTEQEAVWMWNDDPGRTYDEVLRVAKLADEILDGPR